MTDLEDALMHKHYEDVYYNGEMPLIKETP
jgi:hypothetical protein